MKIFRVNIFPLRIPSPSIPPSLILKIKRVFSFLIICIFHSLIQRVYPLICILPPRCFFLSFLFHFPGAINLFFKKEKFQHNQTLLFILKNPFHYYLNELHSFYKTNLQRKFAFSGECSSFCVCSCERGGTVWIPRTLAHLGHCPVLSCLDFLGTILPI